MSKIENISGVNSEGSRWSVRWSEGGRRRCFTRSSRDEVEAKRNELLESTSEGTVIIPPLPRGKVNARWWARVIRDTLTAAHQAVSVGDSGALDRLRKFGRLVAELGHAWEPHSNYGLLEEELEKFVAYLEDLDRARLDFDKLPKALQDPRLTLRRQKEHTVEKPATQSLLEAENHALDRN
jgi:hypothetical protein